MRILFSASLIMDITAFMVVRALIANEGGAVTTKLTLSGATIFILSIDAVEMASDEWKQYLDIEAMKIVSLPQYDNGLYEEYSRDAFFVRWTNTNHFYYRELIP